MQSCTCPLFINNMNPVQGHTGLFWVAVKFESLNTPSIVHNTVNTIMPTIMITGKCRLQFSM